MKPFQAPAHIHSLGGKLEEVTILEQVGDNDYIVDYKGVKCHAIFTGFNGNFYADDKYGLVKEK